MLRLDVPAAKLETMPHGGFATGLVARKTRFDTLFDCGILVLVGHSDSPSWLCRVALFAKDAEASFSETR